MKRILLPRLTLSLVSAFMLASARGEAPAEPQFVEPEIAAESGKPMPEPRFHASASLGDSIDAYRKNPTEENRAAIKFSLSKLNVDIAEQQERLNRTTGADHAKTMVRLEELKKYRSAQLDRMPASAKIASAPAHRRHMARVSTDQRGLAERTKDSALNAKDNMVSKAERVGGKMKEGAKEAAIKTKEGAVTAADKVEAGSKKVGRTIGKGFRKTGEAIERTSEPQ